MRGEFLVVPMKRFCRVAGLAICVVRQMANVVNAATECPADHVTFVDTKGGGSFVVKRVAVRFVHNCGPSWTGVLQRPLKADEGCQGPYRDTIFEGSLNGHKAVAVYTVDPALPCCVW
jgi:hypothetical protein